MQNRKIFDLCDGYYKEHLPCTPRFLVPISMTPTGSLLSSCSMISGFYSKHRFQIYALGPIRRQSIDELKFPRLDEQWLCGFEIGLVIVLGNLMLQYANIGFS